MPHDNQHIDNPFNKIEEQEPSVTADEIVQQLLDRYFEETWGARRVYESLMSDQTDYARSHQSSRTMHVSFFVHIVDATKTLLPPSVAELRVLHPKISAELLQRRNQLLELAVKVFESERKAAVWLQRPLIVTFKGKRPLDLLKNFGGCDQVEAFLRSLYPDRHY